MKSVYYVDVKRQARGALLNENLTSKSSVKYFPSREFPASLLAQKFTDLINLIVSLAPRKRNSFKPSSAIINSTLLGNRRARAINTQSQSKINKVKQGFWTEISFSIFHEKKGKRKKH